MKRRKNRKSKTALRARAKAHKEAIPTKQPKVRMFSEEKVRNLLRLAEDCAIQAALDRYDEHLGIGKWNADILSGLAPSGSQFVGLRRVWRKKRGRPIDRDKRHIWMDGAALRMANKADWSWSKLTRKLDPKGYSQDAHRATDKMRQGIESVLKAMPEKIC